MIYLLSNSENCLHNYYPRCEEEGETGRKPDGPTQSIPDLEGRAQKGVGQNDIVSLPR